MIDGPDSSSKPGLGRRPPGALLLVVLALILLGLLLGDCRVDHAAESQGSVGSPLATAGVHDTV